VPSEKKARVGGEGRGVLPLDELRGLRKKGGKAELETDFLPKKVHEAKKAKVGTGKVSERGKRDWVNWRFGRGDLETKGEFENKKNDGLGGKGTRQKFKDWGGTNRVAIETTGGERLGGGGKGPWAATFRREKEKAGKKATQKKKDLKLVEGN